MPATVSLTFRHFPRSDALESSAREIVTRLQKVHQRITACHIVIEGNAAAPQTTYPYHVKIHLSMPNAQIHAESAGATEHAHSGSALHSAYENAKRQLERLKQQRS